MFMWVYLQHTLKQSTTIFKKRTTTNRRNNQLLRITALYFGYHGAIIDLNVLVFFAGLFYPNQNVQSSQTKQPKHTDIQTVFFFFFLFNSFLIFLSLSSEELIKSFNRKLFIWLLFSFFLILLLLLLLLAAIVVLLPESILQFNINALLSSYGILILNWNAMKWS